MRRTHDAHVIPVTGKLTSLVDLVDVVGVDALDGSIWMAIGCYLRESWNSSPSSRIISSSRPSLKPVGTHEAR
jgi:hypothetical protein